MIILQRRGLTQFEYPLGSDDRFRQMSGEAVVGGNEADGGRRVES